MRKHILDNYFKYNDKISKFSRKSYNSYIFLPPLNLTYTTIINLKCQI